MHAHTILAAAMAFTSLAGARPTSASSYATFYDDDACTQNGGEAVDTANPGCLNESGRNSIYFQAADFPVDQYSLVFSPSPDCPCQEDCIGDIAGTTAAYCYNLDGHPAAQSFRFIGGGCSPNNC